MIFDVASICWEAHIWMNILAALVETRDKYIINIIIWQRELNLLWQF